MAWRRYLQLHEAQRTARWRDRPRSSVRLQSTLPSERHDVRRWWWRWRRRRESTAPRAGAGELQHAPRLQLANHVPWRRHHAGQRGAAASAAATGGAGDASGGGVAAAVVGCATAQAWLRRPPLHHRFERAPRNGARRDEGALSPQLGRLPLAKRACACTLTTSPTGGRRGGCDKRRPCKTLVTKPLAVGGGYAEHTPGATKSLGAACCVLKGTRTTPHEACHIKHHTACTTTTMRRR